MYKTHPKKCEACGLTRYIYECTLCGWQTASEGEIQGHTCWCGRKEE